MNRKLLIMYLLWGALVLTTFFVFWVASMSRGGWWGYVFGVVVLLIAFSLTIIVLTLRNARQASEKERAEIGNPKPLLRNYVLIGLLVFVTVAGMSFFDAMHGAARFFLLAGWQHQAMSTHATQRTHNRRHAACLELDHSRKEAIERILLSSTITHPTRR